MEYVISNIVNFVAMVAVLYFGTRKGAKAFVAGRSENIKKSMADAEALFSKADAERSEWKANWDSVAAHSEKLMKDAQTNVNHLREKTLTAAREQSARISSDTNRLAQSEMEKAKSDLQKEIVEESLALSKQFLSVTLGEGERKKLVEESLELVSHAG
ncbi:MAG: ATP synthase F0 subunit B [Bdellovibrionaceae bacterium]|nr:ATP synthase F0 subunit B [Pseudobdellovibrionaceae bacterium]